MVSVVKMVLVSVQKTPARPRAVRCPEVSSHHPLQLENRAPKKFKHSKNKKPAAATILLIIFVEHKYSITKGLKKYINRKVTSKKKNKLELTSLPSCFALCPAVKDFCIVCQLIFVVHIFNSFLF